VERRGKEFIDQKMPPLYDTLIRSKPVDPYVEAVNRIQQFLQEQDITSITRAVREIQPVNRTTGTIETVTGEGVAESSLDNMGFKDLYRAFNGKDPFTGEKLAIGQWVESVGWNLLTVVPPAKLVKGDLKVGKAAKGSYAIHTTKAIGAKEKLSQLGHLTNLNDKTDDKKGKELSQSEIDRLVRVTDDTLKGTGIQQDGATVGSGAKITENQFQMFNKGKTGAASKKID